LSAAAALAMAGSSSLEAVRRKIRSLQEQADAAEERAGSLQRELDQERKLRETVRDSSSPPRPLGGAAPGSRPAVPCTALPKPPAPAPRPPRCTWRTWASWRPALGGALPALSPRPSRWSKVKAAEEMRVGLRRF
jgi:hypothetical protein